MERFNTINDIEVYELNGKEQKGLSSENPKLTVTNHWNRKEFVVLQIGEQKITVLASQLKRAIDNAQNAHAY